MPLHGHTAAIIEQIHIESPGVDKEASALPHGAVEDSSDDNPTKRGLGF